MLSHESRMTRESNGCGRPGSPRTMLADGAAIPADRNRPRARATPRDLSESRDSPLADLRCSPYELPIARDAEAGAYGFAENRPPRRRKEPLDRTCDAGTRHECDRQERGSPGRSGVEGTNPLDEECRQPVHVPRNQSPTLTSAHQFMPGRIQAATASTFDREIAPVSAPLPRGRFSTRSGSSPSPCRAGAVEHAPDRAEHVTPASSAPRDPTSRSRRVRSSDPRATTAKIVWASTRNWTASHGRFSSVLPELRSGSLVLLRQ